MGNINIMDRDLIIFLDDNIRRHTLAQRIYGKNFTIWNSYSAAAAVALLKGLTLRVNVVSLDHDLDGKFMSSEDKSSGYAVAKFIANMAPEKRPTRIIIHSSNKRGSNNIYDLLKPIIPNTVIQPLRLKDYYGNEGIKKTKKR
jgi:hypothetical protein